MFCTPQLFMGSAFILRRSFSRNFTHFSTHFRIFNHSYNLCNFYNFFYNNWASRCLHKVIKFQTTENWQSCTVLKLILILPYPWGCWNVEKVLKALVAVSREDNDDTQIINVKSPTPSWRKSSYFVSGGQPPGNPANTAKTGRFLLIAKSAWPPGRSLHSSWILHLTVSLHPI